MLSASNCNDDVIDTIPTIILLCFNFGLNFELVHAQSVYSYLAGPFSVPGDEAILILATLKCYCSYE